MEKNITLVVEKVGNGFTVRPFAPDGAGGYFVALRDVEVYQSLGYASGPGAEFPKTLLEFIAEHFAE